LSELDRIVAFRHAMEERMAERTEPFPYGTAFFSPSLARLWDRNYLRLEADGGVDAEELAAEADRIQGAARLAHRKVAVDDAAEGDRLAPQFARLGWEVQRLLVMVHRRPADRAPDLAAVSEVDEATLRPGRVAAARTYPWGQEDETVRQVLRAKQVKAEATRVRFFTARVDGDPASFCEVYSDGPTAQIEDVVTLPEHRGLGLASAVVLRALDDARRDGSDLVFLTADEDDWPKELYRKLGFDDAGRFYTFLKARP
jgi:ribosomal protein S18 acetylase RimI-like enzyme